MSRFNDYVAAMENSTYASRRATEGGTFRNMCLVLVAVGIGLLMALSAYELGGGGGAGILRGVLVAAGVVAAASGAFGLLRSTTYGISGNTGTAVIGETVTAGCLFLTWKAGISSPWWALLVGVIAGGTVLAVLKGQHHD